MDLPKLREWLDQKKISDKVEFFYISMDPGIAEPLNIKEGEGPVLVTEFGIKLTNRVPEMQSYLRGRFLNEPTKV